MKTLAQSRSRPCGVTIFKPTLSISLRTIPRGVPPKRITSDRPLGLTVFAATKDSYTATSADAAPVTATACVEAGLLRFQAGDASTALRLFQRALQLNPNDDEARAALYNSACALTKLKRWQEAADAVVAAVNDRGLKLSVAMNDPDLGALRDRREWGAALERAAGGISNSSFVKLRAEAKAPFRLTRIFLFGALTAGAGAGTLIITARLIAALTRAGSEGAPDLTETLQNFAINSAALSVLGTLLYRDLKGQNRDQEIVSREEALAALQVAMGPDKMVPLAAFRGVSRVVILTGSRGQISKALAAAEPFKAALRERGVSVIPVALSDEDPGEKLRRLKVELAREGLVKGQDAAGLESAAAGAPQGFGASAPAAASSSGKKQEEAGEGAAAAAAGKGDRRWQLQAAGMTEWEAWVKAQAKAAGVVSAGDNFYVQVQLDGSVRASGAGTPPWRQFLDDLAPLDDVRTKFTDGMGMK